MASIASPISQAKSLPPLQFGDRLTRDEFERRYDATPGLKKAELIEGRVYVPPPVHPEAHGSPHADLMTVLGVYRAATPGVKVYDNSSIRLDLDNMPQPDAAMIVLPNQGGQAKIDADGYIEGAPEAVFEIAATSASYDLHEKLHVYRRSGVREYVVWRTFDGAIDYFSLRQGEYIRKDPDAQGRFRSETFPGLWLDAAALLKGDLAAALRTAQEGLQTAEHGDFLRRLREPQQR